MISLPERRTLPQEIAVDLVDGTDSILYIVFVTYGDYIRSLNVFAIFES